VILFGGGSRVSYTRCCVGGRFGILDGSAPTFDDGRSGRTARTCQRRADGTIGTVDTSSGTTTTAGHGSDGGTSGSGLRGVPMPRALLAQQQRLERVPEVLQVVRVQQRVAGRVEM